MAIAQELSSFRAYPPEENLRDGTCYACSGDVEAAQGLVATGSDNGGIFAVHLHKDCAAGIGRDQESLRAVKAAAKAQAEADAQASERASESQAMALPEELHTIGQGHGLLGDPQESRLQAEAQAEAEGPELGD